MRDSRQGSRLFSTDRPVSRQRSGVPECTWNRAHTRRSIIFEYCIDSREVRSLPGRSTTTIRRSRIGDGARGDWEQPGGQPAGSRCPRGDRDPDRRRIRRLTAVVDSTAVVSPFTRRPPTSIDHVESTDPARPGERSWRRRGVSRLSPTQSNEPHPSHARHSTVTGPEIGPDAGGVRTMPVVYVSGEFVNYTMLRIF